MGTYSAARKRWPYLSSSSARARTSAMSTTRGGASASREARSAAHGGAPTSLRAMERPGMPIESLARHTR